MFRGLGRWFFFEDFTSLINLFALLLYGSCIYHLHRPAFSRNSQSECQISLMETFKNVSFVLSRQTWAHWKMASPQTFEFNSHRYAAFGRASGEKQMMCIVAFAFLSLAASLNILLYFRLFP